MSVLGVTAHRFVHHPAATARHYVGQTGVLCEITGVDPALRALVC